MVAGEMDEIGGIYFDIINNIKQEPEETIVDELEGISDEINGEVLPQFRKSFTKSYDCSSCDKKYSDSRTLMRHQRLYCRRNRKEYCSACNKSFYHLAQHELYFHSDQLHHCDLCDFSSKYYQNVKSHKNNIHFMKNKFKCRICTKGFKDQSNRNRHERLQHKQAGIKFECHICPQVVSFSRNDNLTLHLKRIHGIKRQTAAKCAPVLHCDYCGSSYVTKISLAKHMKLLHMKFEVKDEFQCSICDKAYSLKTSLISHLKAIHLKKFCCRVCLKLLGSANTLKIHERRCRN